MEILHTQKIEQLFILSNNTDNIVAKIQIKITSVHNTNSNSISAREIVSIDTNKGSDFITYENLKESDVLGWISSKRDEIKAYNENYLNVQSQTTQKNLPW